MTEGERGIWGSLKGALHAIDFHSRSIEVTMRRSATNPPVRWVKSIQWVNPFPTVLFASFSIRRGLKKQDPS